MLDCAENPDTGFSPIQRTERRWGCLDLLMVSHPHMDHISDIHNTNTRNPPHIFVPFVPRRQLLGRKYEPSGNIKLRIGVSNLERQALVFKFLENWGGVKISCFGLNGYQEDINDYSLVTFLTYGSFTFAYAGDLSSGGWDFLIKQEGSKFTRMLRKTNFFVAAHHGRKEGFNPIIFKYMRDLKMVFISDKEYQPTSVTNLYSQQCKGWTVKNEKHNCLETRKVLTTRNDGRIIIMATQDYRTAKVKHYF